MTEYDPIKFWNNREHPNSKHQSDWQPFRYTIHKNFIKPNIIGMKSILDFGAGKGGFFEIYQEVGIKRVYSYDITNTFKNAIIEHGKKFDFEHIHIIDKVLIPNFDIDTVDGAVSCSCFHHSRPKDIEEVMKQVKKVAKRIIGLEFYNPERKHDYNKHYYSHDYYDIFKRNNWKLIKKDYVHSIKQLHFVVE